MSEFNGGSTSHAMEEMDALIGQVSGNEASAECWHRFESIASTQPAAWEHLARALRDELAARSAFAEAAGPAELAELPAGTLRATSRLAALRAWPGWALAAVIALAWTISFFNPPASDAQRAGLGSAIVPARHSANDAFNEYLMLGAQEGRVLQELPMMMVETRFDSAEGRVEVVYVRQLLERATVQSAYELTEDALGRPAPVPIDLNVLQINRPL